MILPVVKNPINKFTVVRLHFSADPEKRTAEWLEEARRGLSERGWMREYEIDYTYFAGKPFFPDFQDWNIATGPFTYKPGSYMYRGWDYGFHHPCCVIVTINDKDQAIIVKSILGKDEGIKDFGMRVRRYCEANYPGAKWIDAGDPAGEQKSDKSEETSVEMLNLLGIVVQSRKQPIGLGAEIIRNKLKMRVDGKPGLLVDPEQHDVIDGFKGGIHYPDAKDGQEREAYEKDGYFDHCFQAGTKVKTINGDTLIENIKEGDLVLTRKGFKKVKQCGQTKENAVVKTIYFSNGTKLTGTLDHPIWVKDAGWVSLDKLRYGDIIETWQESMDKITNPSKLYLMARNIIDTHYQKKENLGSITQGLGAKDSTLLYGRKKMEMFPSDFKYTTKTRILSITTFLILNAYLLASILVATCKNLLKTHNILKIFRLIVQKFAHLLKNGIDLKTEGSGTQNMVKNLINTAYWLKSYVQIVVWLTKQKTLKNLR